MSVNSIHSNLKSLEDWKRQLKKSDKSIDDKKNKPRGKKN